MMKPLTRSQKIIAAILVMLAAPFVLLVLLLCVSSFLSHSELSLDTQDRAFTASLVAALTKPGDVADAVEIYPGNWILACPLGPYTRVSAIAAHKLRIDPSEVRIADGQDALSNDSVWGVVFLASPNIAEYRRISTRAFFQGDSYDCVERENAQFIVDEARNTRGQPHLRLNLQSRRSEER